jgi:hypothetical protein
LCFPGERSLALPLCLSALGFDCRVANLHAASLPVCVLLLLDWLMLLLCSPQLCTLTHALKMLSFRRVCRGGSGCTGTVSLLDKQTHIYTAQQVLFLSFLITVGCKGWSAFRVLI